MKVKWRLYPIFLITFSVFLTQCGYTLRRSGSPVLEEMGIKTVYIRPIQNQTLVTGAENMMYNALVRRISAQKFVRLTDNKAQADAVIVGEISEANYTPSQSTTADLIEPAGEALNTTRIVATHYRAVLNVSIGLYRYSPKRGISDSPLVTNQFRRSQQFIANNYIGVLGTTSAILNESGFRRSLDDLVDEIATDFNESMLGFF